MNTVQHHADNHVTLVQRMIGSKAGTGGKVIIRLGKDEGVIISLSHRERIIRAVSLTVFYPGSSGYQYLRATVR